MTSLARTGTALVLVLTLLPSDASACSIAIDTPPRDHPFGASFPTNGIFMATYSSGAWEIDGVPVELEADEELSALLGVPVWRPVSGELPAGAELARPCGSTSAVCGSATVAGAPDLVPPSRPVVGVQVTLVDGPSDGSGFGCVQPDHATLTVTSESGEPLDDGGPDSELSLIAYVASSPEAAASATSATALFGTSRGDSLATDVWVGFDGERDGTSPFRTGAFCVAVEVMDAAGNRSPRSEPRCVDTLDRDAPTTIVVDGGGCAVMPGRSAMSGWLLGASLVLGWTLYRRRRRPTRKNRR
jgi:hypothetical protein